MAQEVFRAITKTSTESSGLDDSIAVSHLYEAVGVKLQRANARATLSRITVTMAAGRNSSAIATTSSKAALVQSAAIFESAAA